MFCSTLVSFVLDVVFIIYCQSRIEKKPQRGGGGGDDDNGRRNFTAAIKLTRAASKRLKRVILSRT